MQTNVNYQGGCEKSRAKLEAEQRSQHSLLNCYCREVAAPEGQLTVGPLFGHNDWPMSARMMLQQNRGQALQVVLPHTNVRLLGIVAFASITGNFRYRSPVFSKSPGKPWDLLEGEALAQLLLRELSLKFELPPNTELLDQIRDSIVVAAHALTVPVPEIFSHEPVIAYIDSEQSLTLGHPFHPAPKSRQGFSEQDLWHYSPEMRTSFPLHYFAVRHEHIRQQSLLEQSCVETLAAHAPDADEGFVAIPVHPWQARYLKELPLVQEAISNKRMRYLGAYGENFFPTSSIRTLYQPGNPYFYKFSLNIRITNCVRKNAWYELESALQVTRIMRPLLDGLYRRFKEVRVLEEPAFMSVDLGAADSKQNAQIIEGFGMILRENIEDQLLPESRPILAGALFGNHVYGEARTHRILAGVAQPGSTSQNAIIEQWFHAYVQALMPPILYSYFNHGLIFEPHLQNVVLGLQQGWPRQIFLRDFEGVKLVHERYPESALQGISKRARESLWYSADQGWNRIAYCLFVNNFCEAITQLAAEQPLLQQRLWAIVQHCLHEYQAHHGNTVSARRINALLSSQPLPAKTNLINRFFQRPDREAAYVPVPNPIALAQGNAQWS